MFTTECIYVQFIYKNEEFRLIKNTNSAHQIKINDVTYDVLGNSRKLQEVCSLLNSTSLESIGSEAELKEKLGSLEGISSLTVSEAKKISEKNLRHAKATEDIKKDGPQLRRLSAPELGRTTAQLSEQEEIAKKSGEMWKCTSRKPDRVSNGYIYTFKLDDQYNYFNGNDSEIKHTNAINKKEEMFPAIEPVLLEDIIILNRNIVKDDFFANKRFLMNEFRNPFSTPKANAMARYINEMYEAGKFLQEIGYEFIKNEDGVYLNLPDKETLLSRLEKQRDKFPKLPEIDLFSSEGIADNVSFALAYLIYGTLLSDGKEFVHDHIFHIKAALIIIYTLLSDDNIEALGAEKMRFVKGIAKGYKQLMLVKKEIESNNLNLPNEQRSFLKEHLEKIETLLGMYVDNITAIDNFKELSEAPHERYIEAQYKYVMSGQLNPRWKTYLEKRFGENDKGIAALEGLWKQVAEIEQKYDVLRKKR